MQYLKSLAIAGALACGFASSALASEAGNAGNTDNGTVKLAALVNRVGAAKAKSGAQTSLSIRGGAMVTPRGAGLAGVDFSLPSVTVGNGWTGRVDADVIFKANFGGINTIIPATFDLIQTQPSGPGGKAIYYGGGIGAVLGGNTVFDGKLVLGINLAQKVDFELNVHFTERDTLLTLMGRFHL